MCVYVWVIKWLQTIFLYIFFIVAVAAVAAANIHSKLNCYTIIWHKIDIIFSFGIAGCLLILIHMMYTAHISLSLRVYVWCVCSVFLFSCHTTSVIYFYFLYFVTFLYDYYFSSLQCVCCVYKAFFPTSVLRYFFSIIWLDENLFGRDKVPEMAVYAFHNVTNPVCHTSSSSATLLELKKTENLWGVVKLCVKRTKLPESDDIGEKMIYCVYGNMPASTATRFR